MSYILDALNKSQRENASGTPDLNTMHLQVEPRSRSKMLWIVLVAMLIAGNGAFFYWQTQPAIKSHQSNPVTPVYTVATPDPEIEVTPEPQPMVDAKPVPVSELPAAIRQELPAMTFSSHIYADDEDFRMVSINGRNLHSGDFVAGEVILREITEEGVVFEYRNYLFEMSVLRDWSSD